jgi:DNA polymerase III subunit beta
MRIELTKDDFLEMLQTVIDAVPGKGPLPVLSTVLVVAENGTCTLSTTDLEMSISTSRPLEAQEEGKATFPARKMFDIIRELPSGSVVIAETEGRVTLQSSTGQYTMLGMPASDFPSIPTEIEGASLDVDGDLFKRMVSKVAFAVHPDEATRPTLNGVCWRLTSDSMTMVATDGHRLSKITEAVETSRDEALEVLVPPKVMHQAIKLIREGNTLKTITIGERQIHFSYDNADMFARLIEGAYADVDAVIPRDNDKFLLVDVEALIPAVRRMLILSSQQNHQIRFGMKENAIELSTVNRETGAEARETIEATYSFEEMEIGYNASYLQEVLNKMDTPQARFKFRESVSAAIIEPAEQVAGEEYFCLLMPLRMTE